MQSKRAVIIVCAGRGQRLGKRYDKPLLSIGGKPLFLHAIEMFASIKVIDQIILVLRKEHIAHAQKLITDKRVIIVVGGKERHNSVYNGLCALKNDIRDVLIHDGGRPFVSTAIIKSMIKKLQRWPAVICAVPATDTVKIVNKGIVIKTLPREDFFLVQTPQGFRKSLILTAYRKRLTKKVYDDAQLVEELGKQVAVVIGHRWNIKITYPEDVPIAECLSTSYSLPTSVMK